MKQKFIINELWIYPIKSLGGIRVNEAEVSDRGFLYDRRWMLVDETGRFLSQREFPQLSLLEVSLLGNQLFVSLKNKPTIQIAIPFLDEAPSRVVQIWEDTCLAWQYPDVFNKFFSDFLQKNVELVFMPTSSQRKVDVKYAKNGDITSFSDGYPFLLIGQASLDDLNQKLANPIPMNRFRPNIVFKGGFAFEEDTWKQFRVGEVDFICAKPCARCVVTTISQETAKQEKEPLKTLSTYRKFGNKILFGQNLIHSGFGSVRVGDEIFILESTKASL
jgi:uncharacterized protein YcbX